MRLLMRHLTGNISPIFFAMQVLTAYALCQMVIHTHVAKFGKTERMFRLRGMPFRFSGMLSGGYLLKFGLRMFLPLNSRRYALLTSLSRQASA